MYLVTAIGAIISYHPVCFYGDEFMRYVFDRSVIRDIVSRDFQRLRINVEMRESWLELYRIENSFFIKSTTKDEIHWVRVAKEVVDTLLLADEETYYNECLKYAIIEPNEDWRRFDA